MNIIFKYVQNSHDLRPAIFSNSGSRLMSESLTMDPIVIFKSCYHIVFYANGYCDHNFIWSLILILVFLDGGWENH